MNLNLHIEHIDGGGINETILSPESSKPTSPIEKIKKKCIRNSKNKDENENKPITYLFFKNFIHPTLNNDKKGTKFLYKKQLQKSLDLLKIKYKKGDKKPIVFNINLSKMMF